MLLTHIDNERKIVRNEEKGIKKMCIRRIEKSLIVNTQ